MTHKGRSASKLATLAAVCVSTCASVSVAFAGSVTQPGETIGYIAGAPLPQGLYFGNTFDWGIRSTTPSSASAVDIPLIAWSTPWTILGGRVQFLAAFPVIEVGFAGVPSQLYEYSWYNPWTFGQIAWDLGYGWGFSYGIGAYWDVSQPLAWSSNSLNQRFALSYTGNNWNVTANVIWGIEFDQFNFAPSSIGALDCPVVGFACNPDFVNLDFTATHKFGKFEIGPVAYASWDVSTPISGYARQSQFAVGGYVAYDFGPVTLGGYLTRTVVQENYDFFDTRFWFRMVVPIWTAPTESASPMPVKAPFKY
jgi:hypothetical protein